MIKRLAVPVALAAFYVVLVSFANQRHLWNDELYTLYVAGAPSISGVFKNMKVELHPPLGFLLSHWTMGIFGETKLGVRLPSMLAFFCASMCLYALVRKRFESSSYGALAVIFFWSSPAFYFAIEARPYALILGFFGLATLAFQSAMESSCSLWPVVSLAAAVVGMMLSHFFAIFFLAPFLLAEGVRFLRSRRIDWPILAALIAPAILPFFYLKTSSGDAFPAAFLAGPRKMASYFYWALYGDWWLLLVAFCAAVFIYRLTTKRKPQPACYPAVEIGFMVGLLLLPFIVNAVLMYKHAAFFTRYSVPTLFAFPVLFTAMLARYTNTNQWAAIALCAVLGVFTAHHEMKPVPEPSDFSKVYPDLPLVAASGLTFLEMDHEQPANTLHRLYYLTGRELALKYAHATMFENYPTLQRYFPIRAHVEPFRDFVGEHHRFLVLGTPNYPEDWLLRCLMANHAKLQLLGEFPSESKDSQLYLVEF